MFEYLVILITLLGRFLDLAVRRMAEMVVARGCRKNQNVLRNLEDKLLMEYKVEKY